eukprot:4192008-Prorocentrum_lima.AAC.1
MQSDWGGDDDGLCAFGADSGSDNNTDGAGDDASSVPSSGELICIGCHISSKAADPVASKKR